MEEVLFFIQVMFSCICWLHFSLSRLSPGSYGNGQPNETDLWISLGIAENIWDKIGTQLYKMYIKQV